MPREADAARFDLAPRLPPDAFEPPRAVFFLALVAPDLSAVFFAGFLAGLATDFLGAAFFAAGFFADFAAGRDVLPAPPVFARVAVAPLVPAPPAALVAAAIPVAAPVFCAAPGVDGVPVRPVTSPVSKMLGSIGGAGFTLRGRPRRRGAVTAKRSASSSSSSVTSGVKPSSSSSSS